MARKHSHQRKHQRTKRTNIPSLWLLSFLLLCFIPILCSGRLAGLLKHPSTLEVSVDFPSYPDTMEMARLSSLIYSFLGHDSCNATTPDGIPILPNDLECHLYEHETIMGTQVMVLSSKTKNYVAVAFAGTDNLKTALDDTEIVMKYFGPTDPNGKPILVDEESHIMVHEGFDNAVFDGDLWERIRSIVQSLLHSHSHYRLFTTGHSLGAANSILLAVALHQTLPAPKPKIQSITFGCPRIGNRAWRQYANSKPIGIWRFVNGNDIIARLPDMRFVHVGHTVQLDNKGAQAYYLHLGNKSLDYAGVPFGWATLPYIWLPTSIWAHGISRYMSYLQNKSSNNLTQYFVHDFVPLVNSSDNDSLFDDMFGGDDDDWDVNPPENHVSCLQHSAAMEALQTFSFSDVTEVHNNLPNVENVPHYWEGPQEKVL